MSGVTQDFAVLARQEVRRGGSRVVTLPQLKQHLKELCAFAASLFQGELKNAFRKPTLMQTNVDTGRSMRAVAICADRSISMHASPLRMQGHACCHEKKREDDLKDEAPQKNLFGRRASMRINVRPSRC